MIVQQVYESTYGMFHENGVMKLFSSTGKSRRHRFRSHNITCSSLTNIPDYIGTLKVCVWRFP